jgi:sugar lactone lactonase YvrE
MTIPAGQRATSFLNAITFDTSGRIYVSDSRNGIIWRAQLSAMNVPVEATAWIGPDRDPQGLLGPPARGGRLYPTCCGANGITFSLSGGRMLVANTGFRNIIQIPVNTDGTAGTPSIFVTGINGPDGIAVKRTGTNAGSIWVTANQSDEIVIIDNVTGRVIDKFGDFFGLEAPPGMQCPPTCLPNGLLFPASLAFSNDERTLYVANPAFAQSPPDPASIDTAWAQRVTHWNVVRTTTTFNPPTFPNP